MKGEQLVISHPKMLARVYTVLTLEEEKALYLIFSKLNSFKADPLLVRIEKQELFEKLGISTVDRNSRYLRVMEGLTGKPYVECSDEETRKNWIAVKELIWDDQSTHFDVRLNEEFIPFQEKNEEYMTISCKEFFFLSSKYSLAIYKWIKSWTDPKRKLNGKEEDIEILKELFVGNDKASYDRFLNFENKILLPSFVEMNEKLGLDLNYRKIKGLRGKVVAAEITWVNNQVES